MPLLAGNGISYRSEAPVEYQTFVNLDDDSSFQPSHSNPPPPTLSPNISSSTSCLSPSTENTYTTPSETEGWNYYDAGCSGALTGSDPVPSPYSCQSLHEAPFACTSTSENIRYADRTLHDNYTQGLEVDENPLNWLTEREGQAAAFAGVWQTSATSQAPFSPFGLTLGETTTPDNPTSDLGSPVISHAYTNSVSSSSHIHVEGRSGNISKRPQKASSSPHNWQDHKLRTSNSSSNFTFAVHPDPPSSRTKSTKRGQTSSNKHNQVEKKYRGRLNHHFSQLLAGIPAEIVAGSGHEAGKGKSVSKAETLIIAEQYIRKLEAEGNVLTGENKELLADLERLKEAWLQQGGVDLP
ncbi:hypothetical protein EG329_007000 [Mollisiaceae sp. DMI_Dod_QoI]|nr:hypothetical protein EG329_007000 [Helotiales sp. DMI_Dod_QoI]